MQVQVGNLQGLALNWVVARLEEGADIPEDAQEFLELCDSADWAYAYTEDWAQTGPILHREKISPAYEPSLVYDDSCRWKAQGALQEGEDVYYGPTPQVAVLRCYVGSRHGDVVEVPDEIVRLSERGEV